MEVEKLHNEELCLSHIVWVIKSKNEMGRTVSWKQEEELHFKCLQGSSLEDASWETWHV